VVSDLYIVRERERERERGYLDMKRDGKDEKPRKKR